MDGPTKSGSKYTTQLSDHKFICTIYPPFVTLYSMKTVLFIAVCCLQAHNAVLHNESFFELHCIVVIFWR